MSEDIDPVAAGILGLRRAAANNSLWHLAPLLLLLLALPVNRLPQNAGRV